MAYALRSRFRVDWNDILIPNTWRYLNTQRWLLVFQWLATSAAPFEVRGRTGPFALLSNKPGVINLSGVEPFQGPDWQRDLQRRLWYALMYQGIGEKWREQCGIAPGKRQWVSLPWYEHTKWTPSNRQFRGVDALLRVTEQSGAAPLTWHLNSSHKERAVTVQRVQMGCSVRSYDGNALRKPHWWFQLCYGYPNDSSRWYHTLTRQEDGEPLWDTVERAWVQLRALQGIEPMGPLKARPGTQVIHLTKAEWHALPFSAECVLNWHQLRESYGAADYWAELTPEKAAEFEAARLDCAARTKANPGACTGSNEAGKIKAPESVAALQGVTTNNAVGGR